MVPRAEPQSEITWRELRVVLDEEINRLPEKYRAPVVLCYFEGKTNEEAARQIGCPPGSMSWRLTRAREILSNRLRRRGLALSVGLVPLILSQSASAGVPVALLDSTVHAALLSAAGRTLSEAVSAPVVALTETTLKQMATAATLKVAAAVIAAAVLMAVGSAFFAYGTLAAKPPQKQDAVPTSPSLDGTQPAPCCSGP